MPPVPKRRGAPAKAASEVAPFKKLRRLRWCKFILHVELRGLERVAVGDDAKVLVVAHVRDWIVVAGSPKRSDADDRVRPVERRRLVARHDEYLARLDALLHPHGDRAAREVLEVAANARMPRRVDRAREFVYLKNARIRLCDARTRLVERDVSVNSDAAVAHLDAARVLDHLRQVLDVLRRREDDLVLRHHQVGADAVEEERLINEYRDNIGCTTYVIS